MLARLSRAPVASIASIRGRATGVGSELALASDMRLANREKAILSQWEVGAGLVPGGGPMATAANWERGTHPAWTTRWAASGLVGSPSVKAI